MPTILVADDDDQIRVWVRRILESKGDQVEEARDGKEVLGYLKQAEPALVVLDLFMPNVDGLEVILYSGRVPSQSRFSRFPVTRSMVTIRVELQKCSAPTILWSNRSMRRPLCNMWRRYFLTHDGDTG
jgi:response regulator RpfG family c-di-GMP phosphodiesterase